MCSFLGLVVLPRGGTESAQSIMQAFFIVPLRHATKTIGSGRGEHCQCLLHTGHYLFNWRLLHSAHCSACSGRSALTHVPGNCFVWAGLRAQWLLAAWHWGFSKVRARICWLPGLAQIHGLGQRARQSHAAVWQAGSTWAPAAQMLLRSCSLQA